MTALTVESAKSLAIYIAIGFLVVAIVAAWVIKNVVGKIVSVVLLAGLALGVWTQRTNLQDCAKKADKNITTTGTPRKFSCTFFGSHVDVPAP
jgi:hypothetical protein